MRHVTQPRVHTGQWQAGAVVTRSFIHKTANRISRQLCSLREHRIPREDSLDKSHARTQTNHTLFRETSAGEP